MWRQRIIEAKKAKGITTKMMAERTPSHLTAETITRILNERTDDPRISTVLELGEAVGLSPWELFAEPTMLVAFQGFLTLQAEFETLKAEKDALTAENDNLKNENKDLKDKASTFKAETDNLRLTLEHKEETIAFYREINALQTELIQIQKNACMSKEWKL